MHRVGISANAVGMRLAELGFNDSPVRLAYEVPGKSEASAQIGYTEWGTPVEVAVPQRAKPLS